MEVSAVSEMRDEALNQLNDVVATVYGEGGHSLSDEGLRAVGLIWGGSRLHLLTRTG
ncbi:hypothetical protein [Natronococcus jeotgali]